MLRSPLVVLAVFLMVIGCSGVPAGADGGQGGGVAGGNSPNGGGTQAGGGGESGGGEGGGGGGDGGGRLEDGGCGAGNGGSIGYEPVIRGAGLVDLPDGGRSLTISEDGGATLEIGVPLRQSVSFALTSSDTAVATVSPSTVDFAWCDNVEFHPFTVSGVPDSNTAADFATIEITRPAAAATTIAVTVLDKDSTGQSIVATPTALTIDELDAGTVQVRLGEPPTTDVQVSATVNFDQIVKVSGAPLLFTPQNWNVPQTITITAGIDSDEDDNMSQVALGAVDVPVTNVDVTTNDISVAGILGYDGFGTGTDVPKETAVAYRVQVTETTYVDGFLINTSASGSVRMAVYGGASATNLLFDSGTARSVSTGRTRIGISQDRVLTPGTYWIALRVDSSGPTLNVSRSIGSTATCASRANVGSITSFWPASITSNCTGLGSQPLAVRLSTYRVP